MPGVAVVVRGDGRYFQSWLGDLLLLDRSPRRHQGIRCRIERIYRQSRRSCTNGAPLRRHRSGAGPRPALSRRGRAGRRNRRPAGAEVLAMTDGATVAEASARPIGIRLAPREQLVAAVSRSHLDAATVALLDRLRRHPPRPVRLGAQILPGRRRRRRPLSAACDYLRMGCGGRPCAGRGCRRLGDFAGRRGVEIWRSSTAISAFRPSSPGATRDCGARLNARAVGGSLRQHLDDVRPFCLGQRRQPFAVGPKFLRVCSLWNK